MAPTKDYKSVSVTPETHRALKIEAAKRGISVLELIDLLVAEGTNASGNTGKNSTNSGEPRG